MTYEGDFDVSERNLRSKSDLTATPAKTSSEGAAVALSEVAPFLILLLILGIWQHVYFSYSVGELAFFKNGYDEDTYTLFPFGIAGWRLDRVLAGTILTALTALSHGSYGIALIAFDATFPPAIFLAAYFVGSVLFQRRSTRTLFALVLMFASDLLSLGSVASFPGPFPTLAQFAHVVGESLVPPIETSFLSIYRSPEPQVAYLVGFVFVGYLLRISLGREMPSSKAHTLRLAAAQLLLLNCYAIIAYPLIISEGAVAGLLLLEGRRRKAITLGSLCALSIAAMIISAKLTLGSSSTAVFASRLPVVTVGSLLALLLVVTVLALLIRNRQAWPQLGIALIFATIPLALTNQQVFTGTMVSARDWERTINLALVVVSSGIILSSLKWQLRGRCWPIAISIILVAAFVAVASVRTFEIWLPDNRNSLAIARAIQAAQSNLAKNVRWVLYQPEYAPFVTVRLGRELGRQFNPLLDYTEAFKDPIPSTQSFVPTHLARSLFEYWRQTQVAPEQARDILLKEGRARSGFYSAFLFNLCEYWSPCTDGRHVQTTKIMAEIPSVVDAYSKYLETPALSTALVFVGLEPMVPQGREVIGAGQVGDALAKAALKK